MAKKILWSPHRHTKITTIYKATIDEKDSKTSRTRLQLKDKGPQGEGWEGQIHVYSFA